MFAVRVLGIRPAIRVRYDPEVTLGAPMLRKDYFFALPGGWTRRRTAPPGTMMAPALPHSVFKRRVLVFSGSVSDGCVAKPPFPEFHRGRGASRMAGPGGRGLPAGAQRVTPPARLLFSCRSAPGICASIRDGRARRQRLRGCRPHGRRRRFRFGIPRFRRWFPVRASRPGSTCICVL